MMATAASTDDLTTRNILFMLVDDGGFESPIWSNTTNLVTPHLAKLATRATLFERAFNAVSSCSPSRSAILTGLPTHQNGMYGLHQYPWPFTSNRDVQSIPNMLNSAGYKTGIIGKHHVGPLSAYDFKYGANREYCWAGAVGNPNLEPSSGCEHDYNDATRNVTAMAARARIFLRIVEPASPFFLYVGFGDTHRCKYKSAIGSFCEQYGAGGQFGTIPDWQPRFWKPSDVEVPPFVPDDAASRADIAGMWTAWHRLDAGVGLLLEEVTTAGAADSTLVFFFSDNGIPFPAAKTTLLEQGHHDPLLIFSPLQASRGRRAKQIVSALDFMPTMLAWARISYPSHSTAGGQPASLGGSSLLALLDDDVAGWRNTAFGSHQFHSAWSLVHKLQAAASTCCLAPAAQHLPLSTCCLASAV